MSKAEWEKLYRDAWAIYYTPSHIETILRRAQAYGINVWRLTQIILYGLRSRFADRESAHPLQGGFVRLRNRHERRPRTADRTRCGSFYSAAGLGRGYRQTRARSVAAARGVDIPHLPSRRNAQALTFPIPTEAMTPVSDDENQTLELFTHNKGVGS